MKPWSGQFRGALAELVPDEVGAQMLINTATALTVIRRGTRLPSP